MEPLSLRWHLLSIRIVMESRFPEKLVIKSLWQTAIARFALNISTLSECKTFYNKYEI